MSNTYNPTDMFAPDYEHYQDEDKSQALVTSISGTTEATPSREREVEEIAYNRQASSEAQDEMQRALNISRNHRVITIPGSGEITLKSIPIAANVAVKVCDYNFNRSKLIVSGTGANVGMSTDPSPSFIGVALPNFNTVMIGFTGTFFTREVRTVRDIWIISDVAIILSIQEEFYA